ncbi:hypothetical protein FA95DRAFT_88461 [Auriscalpium vulgare]|uniref:Uncharacterized protein n=1 Tax=Auriscalpium vulgare TaxID=40419 RepID=A0ACB8RNT9_9AGAM|nr:hypothetical protein FA95DRAFT_88461 [Auriscalpium vulgare]
MQILPHCAPDRLRVSHIRPCCASCLSSLPARCRAGVLRALVPTYATRALGAPGITRPPRALAHARDGHPTSIQHRSFAAATHAMPHSFLAMGRSSSAYVPRSRLPADLFSSRSPRHRKRCRSQPTATGISRRPRVRTTTRTCPRNPALGIPPMILSNARRTYRLLRRNGSCITAHGARRRAERAQRRPSWENKVAEESSQWMMGGDVGSLRT